MKKKDKKLLEAILSTFAWISLVLAIFMGSITIFASFSSEDGAKEIFGAERIVIVTQEYHLYRALYIAESLGVEAYGVSADLREYSQMLKHNVREVLARNKDFFTSIFKPKPTYLGEKIDLDGDGNVTND